MFSNLILRRLFRGVWDVSTYDGLRVSLLIEDDIAVSILSYTSLQIPISAWLDLDVESFRDSFLELFPFLGVVTCGEEVV